MKNRILRYGLSIFLALILFNFFYTDILHFNKIIVNSVGFSKSITIDNSNECIPYVQYGDQYLNSSRKQFNPLAAATKAITDLEKNNIDCSFVIADTLIQIAELNDWILPYNFEWNLYKIKKPWSSAMAQGRFIELLISLHQKTSNPKYLNVAEHVFRSMIRSIDQGGTLDINENGFWLEEFASQSGDKSYVLNGNMFAIISLIKYYKYVPNEKVLTVIDKAIHRLENEISVYDNKGYSYYDRFQKEPAYYHQIHYQLLRQIIEFKPSKTLRYYYDRWESYPDYPLVHLFVRPNFKYTTIITQCLISSIVLMYIFSKIKKFKS